MTEVSINSGPPLRFLVDTAATQTVLDTRLGITPSQWTTALTTTGPLRTGKATVSVRAGALEKELEILIADLPTFPTHGRIDGILGMDMLAGHSFSIRPGCVDVDVDPPGRGRTFDATEIAGRVAIRVDGMNLVLDSGASFVVLMSDRAQKLASETGTFQMTSASGTSVATAATVRLFGRDLPAALVRGVDSREDALMPISMFRSVWVSADRSRLRVQ